MCATLSVKTAELSIASFRAKARKDAFLASTKTGYVLYQAFSADVLMRARMAQRYCPVRKAGFGKPGGGDGGFVFDRAKRTRRCEKRRGE